MKGMMVLAFLSLLVLSGCQQAAAPNLDPMFRVENWCQYDATGSVNGGAQHFLPARPASGIPYFYEQAVSAGDYQLTITISNSMNTTKTFTVTVPPTDAGITFAIPVWPSVDWN